MSVKAEIQKRLKKFQSQIQDLQKEISLLELQISEKSAKILAFSTTTQELESVLSVIEKEDNESDNPNEVSLRRGSDAWTVREILAAAGKPLYIQEILTKMGKPFNKQTRGSLSGQLGSYVRRKKIFTRPEANVFGLIEFEEQQKVAAISDTVGSFNRRTAVNSDDDIPF